jgi:hypothetical protein
MGGGGLMVSTLVGRADASAVTTIAAVVAIVHRLMVDEVIETGRFVYAMGKSSVKRATDVHHPQQPKPHRTRNKNRQTNRTETNKPNRT